MLRSRIVKAGNSLAVRIPSVIAKSIGLEDGSQVDMELEADGLRIRRAAPARLSELLARISPDNVHGELFQDLAERERW